MDPGPYPEISYNEHENFIRPSRRGPVGGGYIENKFYRLTPQKYQYYEGNCNVIGVPYKDNGRRNSNFTSLSFVSNALFYEPSKNLGLNRQDMYTTTNQLHQSKSVDKIPKEMPFQYSKNSKSPSRPVRSNNNHIANMTTMETDLAKNINKFYKDKINNNSIKPMVSSKLWLRSNNGTFEHPSPDSEKKELDNSQFKSKYSSKGNGNSRNKTLDRWVTAPTLPTQRELDRQNVQTAQQQENSRKPPRMPCKQRSNWWEVLNEMEYPICKRQLSRASSQENLDSAEESIKSEVVSHFKIFSI